MLVCVCSSLEHSFCITKWVERIHRPAPVQSSLCCDVGESRPICHRRLMSPALGRWSRSSLRLWTWYGGFRSRTDFSSLCLQLRQPYWQRDKVRPLLLFELQQTNFMLLSFQHRYGDQGEHHVPAWNVEVHSDQSHDFGQYPLHTFIAPSTDWLLNYFPSPLVSTLQIISPPSTTLSRKSICGRGVTPWYWAGWSACAPSSCCSTRSTDPPIPHRSPLYEPEYTFEMPFKSCLNCQSVSPQRCLLCRRSWLKKNSCQVLTLREFIYFQIVRTFTCGNFYFAASLLCNFNSS